MITFNCSICMRERTITEMRQILPCFHMFCNQCIGTVEVARKMCLAMNCYTQIHNVADEAIILSYCDNMKCPKKLSHFESTRLTTCRHELCSTCLEEALQKQPPSCVIEKCNSVISELEDQDICDACFRPISDKKGIITDCCKTCLCWQCAATRTEQKTFDKDTKKCAEGKCTPKKKKRSIEKQEITEEESCTQQVAKCKANDCCTGTALNGFPSNSECSHDVCIQCIEIMISDCEVSGYTPMCPNESCRQSYTIDSVMALRTMLPQKADFFKRFELDERRIDVIKDDTVTFADISSDFDFAARRLDVRIMIEGDDDAEELLTFDRMGTVADFIREVRRVLKIMPFDKVYGFYIRREEDELKEEKEMDEEITIDAGSLTKRINDLHLTPECVVKVDMSGIVQAKSHKCNSKRESD